MRPGLAVAALAALAGCDEGGAAALVADEAGPRRVLVVGVDGVRADAFGVADTPSLDAAFAGGAVTLQGSTHLTGVTSSGPGWASILTGVEVEDHGVLSNDHLGARSAAWPTFPERARAAGFSAGLVQHWLGIALIGGPDAFDEVVTEGTDAATGASLAAMVEAGAHDVIFTQFDDVDHAGHDSGFSPDNPAYVGAIEGVDGFVGPALEALAARTGEDWLVLLVTDHGGAGTTHGVPDAANRTIPLGVVGGGVTVARAGASHMDVAATALDWLGVPAEGLDGVSWLR